MSNTKTIAKNTGWFGLENAINSILTVITSIAIARTLGPARMGYMIYVTWIASIVSDLGGLGIPATTRKYMAEFLGRGDRGTARFIYVRTLLLQTGLAAVAVSGLLAWVLRDAGPDYRLAAALVVLSILPNMVNAISAQANVASEDLSRNLPASAVSITLYFILALATAIFHWGVVGVGAAMLGMRVTDFLVRIVPTAKHILAWPRNHVEPVELRQRMVTFAWQSVLVLLVEMVVWERSEFILLKRLCADIRQVAYYSLAFSMAERLLMSATIFGSAASATIFAQYGRDKSRVPEIAASTFRYLALTSIPLHFLGAALAAPALLLLYGKAYAGAALVASISPVLCMPKAFIVPVRSLLQSYEQQSFVIGATVLAGIVDISVAWWLIPNHGAVGACIGSGAAEVVAVGLMWMIAIRLYGVQLPWALIAKVTIISAAAAAAAHTLAVLLSPLQGILVGGFSGLAVLLVLFYATRVLQQQDRARLSTVIKTLPAAVSQPIDRILGALARPKFAE